MLNSVKTLKDTVKLRNLCILIKQFFDDDKKTCLYDKFLSQILKVLKIPGFSKFLKFKVFQVFYAWISNLKVLDTETLKRI